MKGRVHRRGVLAAAGAGLGALASGLKHAGAAETRIRVLSAMPPMPAPPGVASYADAMFARWQRVHRIDVTYEPVSWRELRRLLDLTLPSSDYHHDLVYCADWAAAAVPHLAPFPTPLAPAIAADMLLPATSLTAPGGVALAVPSTTSLLLCWRNRALSELAGIEGPPTSWETLRDHASALTAGETYGFTLNLAPAAGIGSAASIWMALLQQAGGTMWREDGSPAFNDDAGRAALEFLVSLVPLMPPAALTDRTAMDAAVHVVTGRAALTFSWPFLWQLVQEPASSLVRGQMEATVMPSGPAGTATILGSGGWAIPRMAREPEAAAKLVEFLLDTTVQEEQARATGWLSARRSVLANTDLQVLLPHAATVLAQADHPCESFVTSDFDQVTLAMGEAFHPAFTGGRSVAEALTEAEEAVAAIVASRGSPS